MSFNAVGSLNGAAPMLSLVKSRSSPRMQTLMAFTALFTSGHRQKILSLESLNYERSTTPKPPQARWLISASLAFSSR